MSWDGGQSGSGAVIVGFRNGNRIVRVSPDRITLNRKDHTISLSQTALIDKIIHQFGQQDAYPANSPMDPGLKLQHPDKKSISTEDQERLN